MPLEFQVGGRARRAVLWLPPTYDPAKSWPLVVGLHGYEERGDDFEHAQNGLSRALRECPDLYRAVVVLPQCPLDRVWAWIDRPWAEGLEGAEDHVEAAIEATLRKFPIDGDRIALTGNSMGGFGTFLIGARSARPFCSLLPICGGGEIEEVSGFAGSAVWVHHGAEDDVVLPEESSRMVDAIRAAGGSARLDLHEGQGHECWEQVWRDPLVARFLTEQESTAA